jgi:hypothetical protein
MVTHQVLVRGIGFERNLAQRPVVFGMQDTDFPERFLADFGRAAADRLSTAKPVGRSGDGYMHLLQPVQRRVQVALVDLACETVGQPRLSPLRVESAGIVIRRVSLDPQAERAGHRVHRHDLPLEAWMQNPDGKFGWVRLNPSSEDLDPDPARRPALFSGQAALDRLLSESQLKTALTESFSPAFVAPPEICERLARTIVFGVIPTASADVSDQPLPTLNYADGSLKSQMPPLLLAGSHRAPFAGRTVDVNFLSTDFCNNYTYSDDSGTHTGAEFQIFANVLQVVAVELDAFNEANPATALVAALNSHSVTFADGSTSGIGDFLASAKRVLLDYDGNGLPATLTMPTDWEDSTSDDEAAVLQAASDRLGARSASVLAPEGRFQDHTRLYKLRMFLRVRGHDDCPPETIWSEYSEVFEIAPWYEAAGLAGPPVPLPRPTKDFLKATKPNVSFVVPDLLMNAAGASLGDLALGKGPSAGPPISWICGFNIPIITICAFIVLNIFLNILNIIFWWLPFVKICIPIPAVTLPKVGGDS